MMQTRLSGAGREVTIGHDRPTVLIGERINPTGRKALAEAMRAGDLARAQREAREQVAAGADVIDVNVGVPGVDEPVLFPEVVHAVMEAVDVPLSLDTPNPKALEGALRLYRGRPLVNSVTGEARSLAEVLPLVKAHGAAVVALLQGDEGVPGDAAGRLRVAEAILERAEGEGLAREDLVVDGMAMAVAADPQAATVTLETLRGLRDTWGLNAVLGASNVSFGLPEREVLNNAFVAQVIEAGATCLIVNTARVRPAALAADLLQGRDAYAGRYIRAYRQRQRAAGGQ